MSEEATRTLEMIAAIAVHVEAGSVYAVKYLHTCGWTVNEAFELIEQYENYRDQIKAGRIGS